MNEWWEALTSLQRFFYFIAIPSTLILIIQFILSLIGLHTDSDIDVGGHDIVDSTGLHDFDNIDHEDTSPSDGTDFRFVTFRGIIAFLTIFGWVGAVLSKSDIHIGLIVFIATISGLLAMTVVALLFYAISHLQTSGNTIYKNALGVFAEVYIPIPPKNSGSGKIQVMIQNQLIEAEAITFQDKQINTGEMVRVVDLFNQTTFVVEHESK